MARCSPKILGRIQVPPASTTSPTLTNACRKCADLAATVMSAMSARLAPAPAAIPLTAAMMGLGNARIFRISGL